MQDELEPQAAARVGQLVFAFARLDFLLALALRNLLSSRSPASLNPLIERLGFKARLDAMREIVAARQDATPDAVQEFASWYDRADSLRATRNAFVHGRWGIEARDTVFNASTKIGRMFAGEAKIFSLEQLDAEVSLARQVLRDFDDWHHRHVVNAS